MAWAKLHTDILGDVKLIRASRKGARHLVLLPWLIAFAKAADDEGRLSVGGIPAEPEDIAPLIPDSKPAHVAGCLASLAAIGVLSIDTDGAYRFTQWSRRSDTYPSDDPKAVRDRVREHRRRQRNEHQSNEPDSLHVTNGNDSVKRGALAREVEGEGELEERERNKRRGRGSAPDPEWADEAEGLWTERVGSVSRRKMLNSLRPLVSKHAWPAVKAALEVYMSPDEGPAASGRDRRVDWFAADFHRWRHISETPLDDGHGALTDRGRKLLGGKGS